MTAAIARIDFEKAMAFLVVVLCPFGVFAGVLGTILAFGGLLPLQVYLPFDIVFASAIWWSYRKGGFAG